VLSINDRSSTDELARRLLLGEHGNDESASSELPQHDVTFAGDVGVVTRLELAKAFRITPLKK
jgi:hypothetical protein